MAFTLTAHEYAADPETGQTRLVREHPYIRIGFEDASLFLQEGRCWGEGGAQVTDLPDWLIVEMAKISPVALANVGWHQGEDPRRRTPKG